VIAVKSKRTDGECTKGEVTANLQLLYSSERLQTTGNNEMLTGSDCPLGCGYSRRF